MLAGSVCVNIRHEKIVRCLRKAERKHGSTKVPGHAFLAWRSSWRMVVYIYYIIAAGNYISTLQRLSGQPVRYGKSRRYLPSITYKITPAGSLSSSQPGGPPCWTSPLAFGLIGGNGHRSPIITLPNCPPPPPPQKRCVATPIGKIIERSNTDPCVHLYRHEKQACILKVHEQILVHVHIALADLTLASMK
jgi:hypothetical protein